MDARDPANPKVIKQLPMSQTGNFRVGLVFAVGNLLRLSAVGLDTPSSGYTFFDISNPENSQALTIPKGLRDIYAYGERKLSDAHGEYLCIQDQYAIAASRPMSTRWTCGPCKGSAGP